MKPIGISPARRAFLRNSVTLAPAAVAVGTGAVSITTIAAPASTAPYKPTYFTPDEWATLSRLVDRLIPADAEGPGALEAGVAEFLDRQMNTPYAHGDLWYMHGPFQPTLAPLFGYQQPFAPRDLYRHGLAGIQAAVTKANSKNVADLDDAATDALLHQMESGKLAMGEIPSNAFFDQLWQNTREGYFCDPKYGGNKNMDAWRMVGFPGARADYMDWVEQYGKAYPFPPLSFA